MKTLPQSFRLRDFFSTYTASPETKQHLFPAILPIILRKCSTWSKKSSRSCNTIIRIKSCPSPKNAPRGAKTATDLAMPESERRAARPRKMFHVEQKNYRSCNAIIRIKSCPSPKNGQKKCRPKLAALLSLYGVAGTTRKMKRFKYVPCGSIKPAGEEKSYSSTPVVQPY